MATQRIKNLDTFRAIAALVVVVGHLELFRLDHFNTSVFNYIPSGHTAVILFFVISGFLITFLLTTEKKRYGKISFKDFYLRRILRIWPLYFLILLASVPFFEYQISEKTIAWAIAIMPNVSHAIGCGWSESPQIWSIGVENQYYLLFPFVIAFVPKKHIPLFLLLGIVFFSLLPHGVDFFNARIWRSDDLAQFNRKFFYASKYSSLLIGSFVGFMVADDHSWLRFFYNKCLFIIAVVSTIVLWGLNIQVTYFTDELMSLLFAIVIVNSCVNPSINISIENAVIKYLGKISYGIYMWHWVVILLIFKFVPIDGGASSIVLLYILTIPGTIVIAALSFATFESFFLNLKRKFER